MFMFVVRFYFDSCYDPRAVECHSNPMFQSQVVEFINILNERGHTLIGVDRVWIEIPADFDDEDEELVITEE